MGRQGGSAVAHLGGGEWLIWLGTTLFTLALVPQAVRTLKTGRADDFSIPFVLLVMIASGATLIYWLMHGEHVKIWGGFVGNLGVWGIVLWYRLFPRPGSLGHEDDPHRGLHRREP